MQKARPVCRVLSGVIGEQCAVKHINVMRENRSAAPGARVARTPASRKSRSTKAKRSSRGIGIIIVHRYGAGCLHRVDLIFKIDIGACLRDCGVKGKRAVAYVATGIATIAVPLASQGRRHG